jgi:hypothetical protein
MAGKAFLSLDASILDNKETREAIKLDVEYNRVVFEFPEGFSTIPLIEECRALNGLDDFDLMYDITMQMITGKPVFIYIKDYQGVKRQFERFVCVDRHMDLRGVEKINEYPILVNWLVKLTSEHLRKKYPKPSVDELRPTASSKVQKPAKQKKTEQARP